MAERRQSGIALILGAALTLGACGKTGDLYLPEETRDVVTGPAPAPPADPNGSSNSPRSVDSPAVPPTPAPEVSEPEGEQQGEKKKEGGAPPRR